MKRHRRRCLSGYLIPFTIFVCLAIACAFAPGAAGMAVGAVNTAAVPLNRPVQITAETESIQHMAVSADGKWLVYSAGRENFSDLWLRSADPGVVVLPRRLTHDAALESSPALSPDGRRIAFVGSQYDVKGDIYLLDIQKDQQVPTRLTGPETEEGGPCFSPDGGTLYFHQAVPGGPARLVALELTRDVIENGRESSIPRDIDVLGAFPSVSPDGKKIAFVRFGLKSSSGIGIFDTANRQTRMLTHGPHSDLSPVWSLDGSRILFSRMSRYKPAAQLRPGQDNSAIYHVAALTENPRAYPLTPGDVSAFQPKLGADRLFYLAEQGGVANCWSIAPDGMIPRMSGANDQMALALSVDRFIPRNPYLSLLAYFKVLSFFSQAEDLAAQAAYEIGDLYNELGWPGAAQSAYGRLVDDFSKDRHYTPLAKIQLLKGDLDSRLLRPRTQVAKPAMVEQTLKTIRMSVKYQDPLIQARGAIASAHILREHGTPPASLTRAIALLDDAIQRVPAHADIAAEAALLKADIYAPIGEPESVYRRYLAVLNQYPHAAEWNDIAVSRILSLRMGTLLEDNFDERARLLRKIARDNQNTRPLLSAGALNRLGDLYYAADEWDKAKRTYLDVLSRFSTLSRPSAAARLSLAEIYYREKRFRAALDQYETEIGLRNDSDDIYRLARAGYIRKSILAGERLFNLGEILAARKTFHDLIQYDYSIVEAHRGYIKCAAVLKQIPRVLSSYRERLKQRPGEPLNMYNTALCLTYTDRKIDLQEAARLLTKAISLDGSSEYYHQTHGYVMEVLETVHKQPGGIELALESYKKAYFLNNPRTNPENSANLLLNLGNAYFLLQRYYTAFGYYTRRLSFQVPFQNIDSEIIYYRRLGVAAFQVEEPQQAIAAFDKALALIRARTDPYQASKVFDRINRYLMDRIISPAAKQSDLSDRALEMAKNQSDINRRLSEISQFVYPPPAPEWTVYKDGIQALLADQAVTGRSAIELLAELKTGDLTTEEAEQNLAAMLSKVSEALNAPERLAQLKIEMLDRLGLAHQDARQWEMAVDAFESAYNLNQQMGLVRNLARNMRSRAYNNYMLAGSKSGQARDNQLLESRKQFARVIDLVDTYGVPQKEEKEKSALLSLSFQVALDQTAATAAADGFSADQEKRLASAFLTRIDIERGDIRSAAKAMRDQLDAYPPGQPVSPKDRYGVALLYHRAGLLDMAMQKQPAAFENFYHAATLSLDLENAVNAGINVANLGHAFQAMAHVPPGEQRKYWHRLQALDERASDLLDRLPPPDDSLFAAGYHNIMGSHWSSVIIDPGDGVEGAVYRTRAIERAGWHFSRGIRLLESQTRLDNRRKINLLAVLHLNMAALAQTCNEPRKEKELYEIALAYSRRAALPDLAWRALAGLGRLDEALEVLESVPIGRAGSRPFEIMRSMAGLIDDMIEAGDIEEAYNLAEEIAEQERFQRMAPMLDQIPENEKQLYRNIYPRLLRIQELSRALADEGASDDSYLEDALARERRLLQSKIGPRREFLSVTISSIQDEVSRQRVMILLGLARHAEEAADDNDMAAYHERMNRYLALREAYMEDAYLAQQPYVLPLFGPVYAEAFDVMERLTEGQSLWRLFPSHVDKDGFTVFQITPDDILARRFDNKAKAAGHIMKSAGPSDYLAFEDPFLFSGMERMTRVLSGTHFVRAFDSRSPFKRRLLAIPPGDYATVGYDRPAQETVTPPEFDGAGVNTLLLSDHVSMSVSVPTRTGEIPRQLLTLTPRQGSRLRLAERLPGFADLSLAILPGGSAKDAYLIGHLFSLYGCPSLLLPSRPGGHESFVNAFLQQHLVSGAQEALQKGLMMSGSDPQWIVLGYRGLSPEAAAALARQRFAIYVKQGQKALRDARPDSALSHFEKAIQVAAEVSTFTKYLPGLYRLSRESAYQSHNLDRAAHYAALLAQAMGRDKPDSEAHAEALLKLGLIYARQEEFDDALAVLEEAVDILFNLELSDQQAAALADLGIVLENATEYDRALEMFMSAASLSKSLNKKYLLAGQYANIARIYDLRLSRYQLAIDYLKKSLVLYQELGDSAKAAQTHLDIGRCQRLLGKFSAAKASYAGALAMSRDVAEPGQLKTKIVLEQANNAWFQARYQDAFRLQRQAYNLAREQGLPLLEIMALNTEGLLWWTLGDNKRAIRRLEDALNAAKKTGIRKDEIATTLNNLGIVLRETRQYEAALSSFDDALIIDRRLKSQWAVAYDLRNKALTLLKMGQVQQSIPLFEESVQLANAIGNRINEAKALLGLAESYALTGRDEAALDAYRQALGLARQMSIKETAWRAVFGLAKLEIDKHPQKAIPLLYDAVDIIEGMRADIKIEQLKDGFIANKLSVYETLVLLLADQDRIEASFEVAERSRARNFIDLLGNQRLSLNRSVDQALYDRLNTLRDRIAEQRDLAAQSTNPDEQAIYREALQRLNDELSQVMLDIQAANPQLSSLVTVTPASPDKLLRNLDPGMGLISYYILPKEIFCWFVDSDGLRLFRTPVEREVLGRAILEYRRMIQNLEPLGAQARRLYQWLIAPLDKQLAPVKTLGIIPHGPLHYLSFATLAGPDGFLIDRFPLFYLPSAGVYDYTRAKRRVKPETPKVLAMGNPNLGDPTFDLPFAEHEVHAIKWRFPDITILTRSRATEDWIVDNIQKFEIIHLASHGEFNPINPLFSAVKLAKGQERDGDLEAADIFSLTINADLVFLSACQTGLGKISAGDDVVGLNRAFFYAGTHTVISSLWRVSDISTAILTKQFYRLYMTMDKAASLRRAMLHVKGMYPHPGYWGAFTLVGDAL